MLGLRPGLWRVFVHRCGVMLRRRGIWQDSAYPGVSPSNDETKSGRGPLPLQPLQHRGAPSPPLKRGRPGRACGHCPHCLARRTALPAGDFMRTGGSSNAPSPLVGQDNLMLLVSDYNTRAQSFYLRCGYIQAGVLTGLCLARRRRTALLEAACDEIAPLAGPLRIELVERAPAPARALRLQLRCMNDELLELDRCPIPQRGD